MSSTIQALGTRPPGLPPEVRQRPEWEQLRRSITGRAAMRFGEQLTFDFRELLTDAGLGRDAGLLMWQMVRELQPEVLVGPGFGAMPLLYAMALAALNDGINLQVLMVRDQRKGHNQKRWVEGHRPSARGRRAVLVDDFMRNGSAVGLVERALSADKVPLEICAVALFFDMWEPLGSRQLSQSRFPVHALFTRHDLGLSRDAFDAVPPLMRGSAPDFIGEAPLWWRFGLNRATGYPTKCAPVVWGGGAFVADDASRLWRHDLASGEIDWCLPALSQPHKGVVQLLQAVDDSIVFGCYDGTLTRVLAETGAIVWRWRLDSSIHATPWVDARRGRVYINTEQWNSGHPTGHLQCLDWQSGRPLWKVRHGWWPPGSPALGEQGLVVVATCNDGSLAAWDADDGTLRWRVRTHGLVRGQPLVQADAVVVATEQGRLQCWDLADGGLRWTVRYGKPLWHQFLRAHGDHVLVLDGKWHLSAFDIRSGQLRWLTRLRSPGCWAPVACGGHWVVLSREGHLAVVRPEAEVKVWEGKLPGQYHQPPAVGGGVLLAASSTAGLMAYAVHPDYLSDHGH